MRLPFLRVPLRQTSASSALKDRPSSTQWAQSFTAEGAAVPHHPRTLFRLARDRQQPGLLIGALRTPTELRPRLACGLLRRLPVRVLVVLHAGSLWVRPR